jgi:hypothetical protein
MMPMTFVQRNIVIVRTFVVTPADMHAHGVSRDIPHRVIHHLDLMFGTLQKLGLCEVLKPGVTRHRKIGQSSCNRNPAFTMASYSTRIAWPIASTYAAWLG